MKKFALVLMLCCIVMLFSACNRKTPVPSKNVTEYQIDIKLGVDARDAEVVQQVVYTNTNNTALNELYLHLYANNYRKDAFSAAYDTNLNCYGGIDILSLQVEGKEHSIVYLHDATLLKISLPTPLEPYSKVAFAIKYTLEIPLAPLRFGKYDRTVNLGNFYPIMAVHENQGWRLDAYSRIGDPFYSEVANYQINITCDRAYTIASSGNIVEEKFDNHLKTTTLEQNNVRDFALVLSKDYIVKSKKVNNTQVNYYYYLDKTPERSLDIAAEAFTVFSQSFGAYPYDSYNVVEAAFYYGGMEYPALSIINASLQDREDAIVHETAHQWFACLVGTDSIAEAYLDEGLATFSTLLYYKLTGREEDYNKQLKQLKNAYITFEMIEKAIHPEYKSKMIKNLYEYKSAYEYEVICYNKSAIMFDALYQAMGQDAFLKAIKRFYLDNCYKIAKFDNLISAFNSKHFDSRKILNPFLQGEAVITILSV